MNPDFFFYLNMPFKKSLKMKNNNTVLFTLLVYVNFFGLTTVR